MSNMQIGNGKFSTSDLYLAGFLLCSGYRLTGTDTANPQRVRFIISPYPTAELLSAYAQEQAMVEINGFRRVWRELRQAIYGGAR